MPGPLSSTLITQRSGAPSTARTSTTISGRMRASSQASRELSTASLTAVSRALEGESNPRR